ncbi:MAG: hypothetical protein JWO22_2069 [Frankiales bacterium]|nr:hypothetical protein [Frankiales bacterium]
MDAWEVLSDGFGRVHESFGEVATDGADLTWAPEGANPPAWVLWHLARVEDDHIADGCGLEQGWFQGWADRFALPFPKEAHGYGMSLDDVLKVRPPADLLRGYHEQVHAQTVKALANKPDLDRVVDDRWDPPVTLGVRLVSVLSDELQHLGQAAYVLGLPRP